MVLITQQPAPPLPPAIRQQLAALREDPSLRLAGRAGGDGRLVGRGLLGKPGDRLDLRAAAAAGAALLVVAGIGLALVLFLFILRRAFVRLSDGNMATILERQFPLLNDSLLTSVSLLDRPIEPSGFNPQMLAHTGDLACQRMDNLPLSEVFDPMPVVRKVVVALGLALAIGLLAVMAPNVLNLWAQRNLLLAEKSWPRKIRLEAVGFTDGVAKVAAGANFDLRVQAFRGDTEIPVIPEKVEVRYRDDGGGRDRKIMKNIGRPVTSAVAADEACRNTATGLRACSPPSTSTLSAAMPVFMTCS